MADIPLQFPNFGNALMQGAQAGYYASRSRHEAEDERRRAEAQQYVDPAMKGDNTAFGKLAYGDPKTAAAVVAGLSRLDANQRAQLKTAAEYTAHAANAILQASPAERPAIYAQMYALGKQQGFQMQGMPETYSPAVDPLLRTHRMMSTEILKLDEGQKNRDVRLQIHNTPGGGGGPTQIDMPSGAGSMPAPAATLPAGRPSASAVPPDVVRNTSLAQAPAQDEGPVYAAADPSIKNPPKRNGPFFEEEPSSFGYVQRGVKDKYGNVTPMTVEGGFFVYRDPKTNEHVLYKPRPPQPTERALPPQGYQASPDGGLAPIPGGPADPSVIARNTEARRRADEKAIPQTVANGIQKNLDALKQLDRLTAELNKVPDSTGGIASTVGTWPIIGGPVAWGQNKIDREGTQLRALIADIGSMKIHERSGAAVTASEFPRLRPFIPTPADDAETVRSKIANFRAELESHMRDVSEYYGPANGFREYTPATKALGGPAAPSADASPDQSKLLFEARDAISKGAPREKVLERLKSLGVDASGL